MTNPVKKTIVFGVILIALIVGGLELVKRSVMPDHNHREASSEAVRIEKGKSTPDFDVHFFQGETQKISTLKHKIAVINFWASWCEACVVELPSLVKLRKLYKDKGMELYLVNVDENPESIVPQYIKKFSIESPVVVDTDQKLSELFDISAIPHTLILDQNRKVLFIESGERDWTDKEILHYMDAWTKE